jgi:phosphatidylserine/phosphatidylglycerophosphate/cardiolipin synthase-like enzyme
MSRRGLWSCLTAALLSAASLATAAEQSGAATQDCATPAASGTAAAIEVYFPPWDNAEQRLLEALHGARQQILVQAFLLTSRDIANALIAAHHRGVEVSVLADAKQHADNPLSQLPSLARAGIPVWLEDRYRNAHNKVIVVDAGSPAAIVLTGSYNFTRSAQRLNAENLLIIRGQTRLADQYAQNWQRHRAAANPIALP